MIILGLGSNLSSNYGDRFQNIELALLNLQKSNIQLLKRSSFYETPSYPDKENPKFINIVIEVTTNLSPEKLASIIINTEKQLERERMKKNDPRTCDIDIIDFKGQNMVFKYNSFDFEVPHTKLIDRNFVLIPLNEIIPYWKHPKSKEPISSLINKLSNDDKNSILKVNKS